MADHRWDEVVYLGDFMDFGLISSHNKDNLRAVAGRQLDNEYAIGSEILDRHQKLAPHATLTLLEGNHEHRIERYVDANPVLEGKVEVDQGLELTRRKIKWIRFWSKGDVLKIGKARFIHGAYTNQYHAKKHVEAYGHSVFYGHTHDVQLFSKELKGDNKTIVGQSLGCLCNYNQPYMRGKPNKWQQAFAVFYFLPNGHFTYYVPFIFNHTFVSPEGKVYEGTL